jgi:prepilin-type N-terminal cleavage/methylation domain-containing protein
MRARRGFTLWEMSITLAIMAVAATLVIPVLTQRFGTEQPPQSGDALMALLRDARRTAILHAQTVSVRVDPATGLYRVDTTGIAGTGLLAEGGLGMSAWETLVTDLPRLQYVFRPTGAAFGDTVVVRGSERTVAISLDPWSGYAILAPR